LVIIEQRKLAIYSIKARTKANEIGRKYKIKNKQIDRCEKKKEKERLKKIRLWKVHPSCRRS
jgi:hypothetical protein